MLVDLHNLADGASILKLGDHVLLDSQDEAVTSLDGNCGISAVDSLKGILHLEELAIGRENSVCFVVSWHRVVWKSYLL